MSFFRKNSILASISQPFFLVHTTIFPEVWYPEVQRHIICCFLSYLPSISSSIPTLTLRRVHNPSLVTQTHTYISTIFCQGSDCKIMVPIPFELWYNKGISLDIQIVPLPLLSAYKYIISGEVELCVCVCVYHYRSRCLPPLSPTFTHILMSLKTYLSLYLQAPFPQNIKLYPTILPELKWEFDTSHPSNHYSHITTHKYVSQEIP